MVVDLLWRLRGCLCGSSGVLVLVQSMKMQRIAFPTLLTTFLALGPAFAGPLNLNPQAQPAANSAQPGIGSIFASPPPAEPAPTRYAQTNYGGGFIEMLFRGPGGSPPQRYEQPEPQPAPMMNPNYRRPHMPDQEVDGLEPAATSPYSSRAAVNPRFLRQEVIYDGRERPGTVIINTRERLLYYVQADGRAIRYGIGVGRPGFNWAGTHTVTTMREWPDWRPPPEMLRRQPNLPRHMPGGPDNPLGARAMYLGSTLYRIHGSNEPWTIGQAVSSGCIRMRNEDVIDLYQRVRVGTRVVVI